MVNQTIGKCKDFNLPLSILRFVIHFLFEIYFHSLCYDVNIYVIIRLSYKVYRDIRDF